MKSRHLLPVVLAVPLILIAVSVVALTAFVPQGAGYAAPSSLGTPIVPSNTAPPPGQHSDGPAGVMRPTG